MRLLSHHPQDLSLARTQNFPFFLDGGRVDPVFGIHEPAPPSGGCFPHPPGAGQGLPHHGLSRKTAGVEALLSGPEVTGERLFHDDVLVGIEGLNGHGLVHIGRCADIHHVDCIQQARQGVKGRQPVGAGKDLSAFPGPGHHPYHLYRDPKDLPVAGQMESGRRIEPPRCRLEFSYAWFLDRRPGAARVTRGPGVLSKDHGPVREAPSALPSPRNVFSLSMASCSMPRSAA